MSTFFCTNPLSGSFFLALLCFCVQFSAGFCAVFVEEFGTLVLLFWVSPFLSFFGQVQGCPAILVFGVDVGPEPCRKVSILASRFIFCPFSLLVKYIRGRRQVKPFQSGKALEMSNEVLIFGAGGVD